MSRPQQNLEKEGENHNNYGRATPKEGKINVGSLISLSQSQAREREWVKGLSTERTHTHMYTNTSKAERSYETWRINQAYIATLQPQSHIRCIFWWMTRTFFIKPTIFSCRKSCRWELYDLTFKDFKVDEFEFFSA